MNNDGGARKVVLQGVVLLFSVGVLAILGTSLFRASQSRMKLEQGVSLYQHGRFEESISIFRSVLQQDSRNVEAWQHLSDAYLTEGKFTEALEASQKGLQLAPRHRELLRSAGSAMYDLTRYTDAMEFFSRLISIEPQDFDGWVGLGSVALTAGEVDNAEKYFKEVIRHVPSHRGAIEGLISVYQWKKETSKIVDLLEPVVLTRNVDPYLMVWFIGALYEDGLILEAVWWAEKVKPSISSSPFLTQYLDGIIQVVDYSTGLEKSPEIRTHWLDSVQKVYSSPSIADYANLAYWYSERGYHKAAAHHLKKQLQLERAKGEYRQTLLMLSEEISLLKQPDALDELWREEDKYPDLALRIHAQVDFLRGDARSAVDLLKKALLDTKDNELYACICDDLILVYLTLSERQKADEIFSSFLLKVRPWYQQAGMEHYLALMSDRPWKQAWEIEGKHVVVRTNTTEETAKRLVEVTDRVFPECERVLHLKSQLPGKVRVNVFRTDEEHLLYYPYDRWVSPWTPHEYYEADTNSVRMSYRRHNRASVLTTAAHEVTHGFLRHAFPVVPAWLNEGVAECMESTVVEAGGSSHRPDSLRRSLLETLRQSFTEGKLIPISKLVEVEKALEAPVPDLFYAQSWSLVQYFLSGKYKPDQQRFEQFLKALQERGSSVSATDLFRESFDQDLESLDAWWRKYLEAIFEALDAETDKK